MLSDAWGSSELPITRGEMRLLRRSARENWGVPEEMKDDALIRIWAVLQKEDAHPATHIAAVKTLAELEKTDLAYRAVAGAEKVADEYTSVLKLAYDAARTGTGTE